MSIIDTPLSSGLAIVDSEGRPTAQFQMAIQRFIEQLNAEFGALEAAQAAQAAAATAQTAAETAQAAAEAAQASAAGGSAEAALVSSGTVGCLITAADVGTDAAISVSAHTRVYGDGSQVALSSGSIGPLAFSTFYYVYYIDPSRTGGAVAYLASEDPLDAIQTGNVHSVGNVTTPADGDPFTTGIAIPAPGGVS